MVTLTKSIVPTSGAVVVRCSLPAFGFRTLPMTWIPLSTLKSIDLLYIPSTNFSTAICFSGYPIKLIHVGLDASPGQFLRFFADKSTTAEPKEILVRIPRFTLLR